MVLERAEMVVKSGSEEAFDALRPEIMGLLEACPGCRSAKVLRGIESPNKFLFLLEWDSVEAHGAARTDANFGQFRDLIAPHSESGIMEHFRVD